MSCEERMGLLISRYVDDEVTPDERGEVGHHLRECETCRDFWEILQRNENLVASALSESRFGSRVMKGLDKKIESAPNPVRAVKPPVEAAKPAVKPFPRVWTAAAASVLCAVGLLALQQYRLGRVERSLAAVRDNLNDAHRRERDSRTEVASLVAVVENARQAAYQESVAKYLSHRDDAIAAYVGNGVTVMARFPRPDSFTGFNVRRRLASEVDFGPALNDRPLARPEFVDLKADPGQDYEYEFVGLRTDGTTSESVPVRIHVEGEAAADAYPFELRCIEIRDGVALVVLTTRGNGDALPEIRHLRAGEDIAGFKFEKTEDGDEVLTATLPWPQCDEQNRPVIDPATGKTKIKYDDAVLSVRPNTRLILRRGDRRVSVWRQGRVLLPR